MSKKETVSSNEGKIQKNSQEETVAEIMPEVKNTSKMKGMIQSLEMMAMQRSSRDNLDISKFTDAQRDKLLDIMSKNEDNAFKFHNKRLEVTEKLNTKIIESTTVSQRTIRYIGILALLLVFALMVIILVYKDQYFSVFLSFIAGLGLLFLSPEFCPFKNFPYHCNAQTISSGWRQTALNPLADFLCLSLNT